MDMWKKFHINFFFLLLMSIVIIYDSTMVSSHTTVVLPCEKIKKEIPEKN